MSIWAILLNYRGAGKLRKRLAAGNQSFDPKFFMRHKDTSLCQKPAKIKQKFRLAINVHLPQKILRDHE